MSKWHLMFVAKLCSVLLLLSKYDNYRFLCAFINGNISTTMHNDVFYFKLTAAIGTTAA